MTVPGRYSFLQVCLTLSAFQLSQVSTISVKFGTSGGPIVPPTPSPPTPPPQPPFRDPAPVWEETDDIPNPNPYKAPVPPHLAHIFGHNQYHQNGHQQQNHATSTPRPVAQPAHPTRYTQVLYQPKKPAAAPSATPATTTTTTTTLSPAKSFVQAYAQPAKATQATQTNNNLNNNNNVNDYDRQRQYDYQRLDATQQQQGNFQRAPIAPQLGIRYVPGYGFKYITPEQDQDPRKYNKQYYNGGKYFHDKYNSLESNDIFAPDNAHPHDAELAYDKFVAQRVKKSPEHQTYYAHQPFTYYHHHLPQQHYYPVNYV